ncbi:MAG: LptE family protein [Candidatus Omnitrophica bacterium]|nr:LptE family protein [Candidatus Omnitrophota bacterium]
MSTRPSAFRGRIDLAPFTSKGARPLLLLLALTAAGCGYSATRLLPAYYQTIYVEAFDNKIPITEEFSERVGYITNIPEIEEKVTRGVIDRFLFDGNLRVTNKPETADLVLTGQLRDFYRQAIRKQDDSTVEEYRLNLTASVTLRDKEGKLLLEEPNLVADSTYFLSGALSKTETASVDELVADFSRRIVEWVIEYW